MQKYPILFVSIKYGLVGSAVAIACFLGFYFLHENPLLSSKLLDVVIILIFLIFSMKEFKDVYTDNEFHFWQGMSIGMINYLTIALLSGIFIWIMVKFVDPELLKSYIQERIQLIETNKNTIKETFNAITYQQAIDGVRHTTAFDLALDDFLKNSIIGLFLTIIISVIFRNPTTLPWKKK